MEIGDTITGEPVVGVHLPWAAIASPWSVEGQFMAALFDAACTMFDKTCCTWPFASPRTDDALAEWELAGRISIRSALAGVSILCVAFMPAPDGNDGAAMAPPATMCIASSPATSPRNIMRRIIWRQNRPPAVRAQYGAWRVLPGGSGWGCRELYQCSLDEFIWMKPWNGRYRTSSGFRLMRRSSCAFSATTIVDSDISTAPAAGERTNPANARRPAAGGTEMML